MKPLLATPNSEYSCTVFFRAKSSGGIYAPVPARASRRNVFKYQRQTPPATLTDIQRAARFFYFQQHAFGGKVDGQTRGTATTVRPSICSGSGRIFLRHLRLSSAYIENMDWYKLMERFTN
ncbi:MAG: hypothetical protein V4754_04315 [Pseudomonadota bacterium]